VIKGGKIVLGAEQLSRVHQRAHQCASASWLYWSVIQYVMPRATQLTLDGKFTNSR